MWSHPSKHKRMPLLCRYTLSLANMHEIVAGWSGSKLAAIARGRLLRMNKVRAGSPPFNDIEDVATLDEVHKPHSLAKPAILRSGRQPGQDCNTNTQQNGRGQHRTRSNAAILRVLHRDVPHLTIHSFLAHPLHNKADETQKQEGKLKVSLEQAERAGAMLHVPSC